MSALPAVARQADEPKADDAKAEGLVVRTKVELVLLEAVVLDRRGRHVRGLDGSGFRLLYGGLELPITTFDEIDLARPVVPPSDPGASVPPDDAAPDDPGASPAEPAPAKPDLALRIAESRLRGNRWFIMIFDGYNNVSPLKMNQMRRAAKKWVDSKLRVNDLVAIYEFNPYLSSTSGFTGDPFRLKAAIEKVRMFPGTNIGTDLISQKIEQGGSLRRDILEQQLTNAGRFGGDLLSAERDQYYMNVSSIAGVMSGLEGTKAVLLFSGGFPLTRTRSTAARGGFTPRFKDMLKGLEEFGVRVFSFDIGEDGGFTDASKSTNFRLSLDQLGLGTEWMDTLQVGAQIDSLHAHHEILSALGSETGGRFWRGQDFNAGLQAADDDLSHYYLIGYHPISTEKPRGYARTKLKHDEGKYKIITRGGHFNLQAPVDPDEAVASLVSVSTTDEGTTTLTPTEPGLLELSVRPLFYPTTDGRTMVVLPINVEGPIGAIRLGDQALALDLDIGVVARDAEGELVEEGQRNVRLQMRPEGREALEAGIQLREAILLPAETLDLSVSVRLNGLSRSGAWNGRYEIPDRNSTGFGLSELALLSPAAGKLPVYDVFQRGEFVFGTDPPRALDDPLGAEATGRPPLYTRGDFPREAPLLAQVQVVAPPPAPPAGEESPLRMDWELIPDGGGVSIAPPVNYRRLQMIDDGRLLDVVVGLDLAEVLPGIYTLRLTAMDLVTNSADTRFFPITISN